MQQKYELGTRLTYKWKENIPKFYFCIRAPTFSTHMPCPLKICFTNKVNTICGGGQLLVTWSQGPITRALGVRIPCPSVTSPKAQGPNSRVSVSQVSGSRVSGSPVSGLGVPGLSPDFRLFPLSMRLFALNFFF